MGYGWDMEHIYGWDVYRICMGYVWDMDGI